MKLDIGSLLSIRADQGETRLFLVMHHRFVSDTLLHCILSDVESHEQITMVLKTTKTLLAVKVIYICDSNNGMERVKDPEQQGGMCFETMGKTLDERRYIRLFIQSEDAPEEHRTRCLVYHRERLAWLAKVRNMSLDAVV